MDGKKLQDQADCGASKRGYGAHGACVRYCCGIKGALRLFRGFEAAGFSAS